MTTTGDDPQRRVALERLRQAAAALTGTHATDRDSTPDQDRLLAEFREAVGLADDLLILLEHHVRGPLTVVKGRAQILRRQALATPQPDIRLIAGLNEIDLAVERIVAHLDRLLGPRVGAADGQAAPFDGDVP